MDYGKKSAGGGKIVPSSFLIRFPLMSVVSNPSPPPPPPPSQKKRRSSDGFHLGSLSVCRHRLGLQRLAEASGYSGTPDHEDKKRHGGAGDPEDHGRSDGRHRNMSPWKTHFREGGVFRMSHSEWPPTSAIFVFQGFIKPFLLLGLNEYRRFEAQI